MAPPESAPTSSARAGAAAPWLRLFAGAVAVCLGVAVLAWPEATVRVVGFLFGLSLLVGGLARGALSLFAPGLPASYRVLGAVFGLLTTIAGVICLRNVAGSVALLVLVVGLGWLIEGLTELVLAFGGGREGRGARVSAGLLSLVLAIAVFVWPELTLATFVAIGAIILVVAGVAQVAGGIGALRAARRRARAGRAPTAATPPSARPA